MSASQRRVQPALNTEDRRASILLWLFSLIAAPPPPAEMLPLQMFSVIVPHLQFQSSGCFPTISEESASTEGGWGGAKLQFVAAKWEIEKRAIMIHAPAPIYGATGATKKDWFLCCF